MKKVLGKIMVTCLVITMVLQLFVQSAGAAVADEYDQLRGKWVDYLLGGNYDLADVKVTAKLTEINDKAQGYWSSMEKSAGRTYLWSDLAGGATDSTPMGQSYVRVQDMVNAYAMEGTGLYQNQALLVDIIDALDWLNANWYHQGITKSGNWWWYGIGVPLRLTSITAILYDQLSASQITSYMSAVRFFTDITDGTAANRVDICQAAIIEGIIVKDSARIVAGRDALGIVYPYVTTGNGYYADGSYVDHDTIPYTHSYGAVLIGGLSRLMYVLGGSSWQITEPGVQNVYRWIYDSYETSIYEMQAFDNLRGRAVSREHSTDLTTGKSLLGSIAMIAESAPAPDAAYYKSMIKHMITENPYYEETSAGLYHMTILGAVKNDANIQVRGPLVKHSEFSNMDRSSHFANDFAYSVSKSSKRIWTYELINGENQKGWYTGSGMTYLYNEDKKAYSDDFWATVNYYRLPGTTVDTLPRNTGHYQWGDGEGAPGNSWSGGVTLKGIYGSSGMNLQDKGTSLSANKSWFMFDDEIVAVGSGINSTDSRTIETIVEQRKINDSGTNALTVNGVTKSNALGWAEDMTSVSWAHLEGNTLNGSDIGYYFPNMSAVKATRQAQSGSWYDININPGVATDLRTKNYMTMWFDHGINPVNGVYSYVTLPNKTAAEVSGYAANPDISIIKNTPEVHCVKEHSLNITAANFWKNEQQTAGIITSDKMASVMIQENADLTMDVAVSDPTMENQGSIIIEIAKEAPGGIISASEGVQVIQTSPSVKLMVNVAGSKGKAFEAKVNIDPTATPVQVNWYSSPDFSNPFGLGAGNVGKLTIESDVTPLGNNIDGVIGYADSSISVSGYSNLPIIIRMNPTGYFDVRDGSTYRSIANVPYVSGQTYHVRAEVDMTGKLYDVFVKPTSGAEVKIAENFVFRSDAPVTDDIGQVVLKDFNTAQSDFSVANHVITVNSLPTTVRLHSTEAAFVRDGSYGNTNYGFSSYMVVCEGSIGYNRNTLVKFDLSSYTGTVSSAKVVLVPLVNIPSTATHSAYICSTDHWSESGVTWNNQPVISTLVGNWSNVTAFSPIEIEVTAEVNNAMLTDKSISMTVKNTSGIYAYTSYASDEHSNVDYRPVLVITE